MIITFRIKKYARKVLRLENSESFYLCIYGNKNMATEFKTPVIMTKSINLYNI